MKTSVNRSAANGYTGPSPGDTFEVSEDCVHPEVTPDCAGGWCTVLPGCFVFGTPLDEPCRAPNHGQQVQVTLTKSFRMRQIEVTIGEWTAMGFPNPTYEPTFDGKPVTNITWHEALAYCDALSEAEGKTGPLVDRVGIRDELYSDLVI